jgi:hypothetical protein
MYLLTLADLSIDFSENGDFKDRWKNVAPFFKRKIRGRLPLHSDYQLQGTNIIGQFYLFRHDDLLVI